MENEEKRIFFGIEINAPWPEKYPLGKLIAEKDRHITLAFLGKKNYELLKNRLNFFPKPPFQIGFAGIFDKPLFFPTKEPRVAAWNIHIIDMHEMLINFQNTLIEWLKDEGFCPDCRHAFTPHTTLARSPFSTSEWKIFFSPLPVVLTHIHLYESLGHSKFHSLWHYPILAPFDPIEHTADIAFLIRGENYAALYRHAFCALAFTFPPLVNFFNEKNELTSIVDVIEALNDVVFESDKELGCPFKAISYHTDLEKKEEILNWEMIVDV